MSKVRDIKQYIISKEFINKDGEYFLDANVWIYCLSFFNTVGKPHEFMHPYYLFFQGVIINNKNFGKRQKFVITKNLLMEIITNYMRGPIFKSYNRVPILKSNYNEIYKKFRTTDDYKKHLKELVDSFLSYKGYLQLLKTEPFDHEYIEEFLMNFAKINFCDINDYDYYQLCKKYKIPIVTNDPDFFNFGEIEIITNNQELLKGTN